MCSLLAANGLLPSDGEALERVLALNPCPLRRQALDERLDPHQVGRVLVHLNQRRGFLSNRKTDKARDSDTKGMLGEISTLAELQGYGIALRAFEEGDIVYVALLRSPIADSDDPFRVRFVSSHRPSDENLFIRGRVTQKSGDTIMVEYGIEQYFVPEGRGLDIERADDVKVRVSINGSGTAAIKELIVDGEVWRP